MNDPGKALPPKITLDERALGIATRAAYESVIEQACGIVERRQTTIDDMPQLFERIHSDSETAQVLIFGSYLEDRFRSAVAENLLNLDDTDAEERLFGGFGPLSNFGSRILLAYHLGWISKGVRSKLDSFRKLRNEFAHNAFRVSFSDHSIQLLVRRIAKDEKEVIESMHKAAASASPDAAYANRSLTDNQWVLCFFALLAGRAIEELSVFAIARERQLRPEDLLAAVRKSRNRADASRTVARTVLEMFTRGPIASPRP